MPFPFDTRSTPPMSAETPMPEAPLGKKINIANYRSPNGELGGKEFKLSLWYVKHEVLLFKILMWGLIGLNVLLWVYSLISWGSYVIFGIAQDKQLEQQAVGFYNYDALNLRYSAQPIQVLSTQELLSGTNKVDAVAEAANPNDRFIVYFDYYFTYGSAQTPVRHGFLLPRESRPVAELGLDPTIYSGSPTLSLTNITWKRISSRDVADVPALVGERLNIVASEFKFLRRGSEAGLSADAIQFKLTNFSAFGYKAADFYVGLYQNNSLVQILPLTLSNFTSMEVRDVDIRSFAPNLSVSDLRVFPIIDIFNNEVYMKP